MSSSTINRGNGGSGLDAIDTPHLTLVPLDADVLKAFATGDTMSASSLLQVSIGPENDLPAAIARMRLSQLQDDPTLLKWLLRAVVRRENATMVGHIGFHSAPNPEYLHELAQGAVEIGYTIYAPYRRNGYAFEAAQGLMRWATNTYGVTDFVASVSPENVASVGLIRKLEKLYRVKTVGHYVDPEDGPEDIYCLQSTARS